MSMAHIEPRNRALSKGTLIQRFGLAYEYWLKRIMPESIWKILLHHPDSFLRSDNPKREIMYSHILIVLASIAVIILLLLR